MSRLPLAVTALAWRDVIRFVRQPSRVIGALLQPLVFWLLLGGGLRGSFAPPGMEGADYMEYFYPGILALTLLFTAIFATISVVEDRRSGFLQGVLAAPVPRAGIVLGQAGGAALLAVMQGCVMLTLSPAAGLRPTASALIATVLVMLPLALSMTGLGLTLAWRMESTQGFHAIMNLVLMPMWLLSGAFFPASGAPAWLAWIMRANPMTYGMAALRRALYLDAAAPPETPSMPASLLVMALFGAITLVTATVFARRSAP